ncbi:MAG: enoyl-CoA hydratase-related protein [Candidatus Eiseniibacteriota bacterium]
MLVEVERQGAVARVWFNRPETHNALSADLGAALLEAMETLARDHRCRVVVLGGRGPSFCAGADIATMRASANAGFEDNLAEAGRFGAWFAAVAQFPKPVVARLHGGVYGGGVGLCCACDIAVASADAKFGLTESRLGIIPGLISPYVIRRLGDRQARELMLTGERFGADMALRVGLIHHLTPEAGLDARVDERVTELLKAGPAAQARIKRLLAHYANTPWDEYRAALPRALAEVRATEEARDGLSAFLEKRKPRWME